MIAGNTLASSLNPFRHKGTISIVHMGENTGRLDSAFEQIITYLELEKDTKQKIHSATRYPLFVVLAMLIAIVIINIKVIPAFSGVFRKLGEDLPLATELLLTTSAFFTQYWLVILILLGLGLIASWVYFHTDDGRTQKDRLLMAIPIIGPILSLTAFSRFARPFAIMIDCGVPILQALQVCSQTVQNRIIAQAILNMKQGIERGDSLLTPPLPVRHSL